MRSDNVEDLIEQLGQQFGDLSPQLRKAARYVMDKPQDVSISTVRALADAADVKPNTFVRLASQLGYDGYDDFRELFRKQVRRGNGDFQDRVRWLQAIQQKGDMGALYASMVNDAISNLEQTFADIDEEQLRYAADLIWQAENVYCLGVGVNYSSASNFTYLASTGMKDFRAIPSGASTAIDDLAFASARDVLIAITMQPYRTEVLEAVTFAGKKGMKIIGISDSQASPVITKSDYGFITHIDTSQFFPSSVAIIALLETLLSFVVATASGEIVDRVTTFHERRHQNGLYHKED